MSMSPVDEKVSDWTLGGENCVLSRGGTGVGLAGVESAEPVIAVVVAATVAKLQPAVSIAMMTTISRQRLLSNLSLRQAMSPP
jgi:hypothetical protein